MPRSGDEHLLRMFRSFCLRQFAVDLTEGDAAVAAADRQALRRLAHNLKSVLSTLGEDEAAACAARLDERLAAQDGPAAEAQWQVLRTLLARLTAER